MMNRVQALEKALHDRDQELGVAEGAVSVAQAALNEAAEANEAATGYEGWRETKLKLEYCQRELDRAEHRCKAAVENAACARKALDTARREAEAEKLERDASLEMFFLRVAKDPHDHRAIEGAFSICRRAQRELEERGRRVAAIQEFHREHAIALACAKDDGAATEQLWRLFQHDMKRGYFCVEGLDLPIEAMRPRELLEVLVSPHMHPHDRARKVGDASARFWKHARYVVNYQLNHRAQRVGIMWSDRTIGPLEPTRSIGGREVALRQPGLVERIGRALGVAAE
jgi:hypothetical protein